MVEKLIIGLVLLAAGAVVMVSHETGQSPREVVKDFVKGVGANSNSGRNLDPRVATATYWAEQVRAQAQPFCHIAKVWDADENLKRVISNSPNDAFAIKNAADALNRTLPQPL